MEGSSFEQDALFRALARVQRVRRRSRSLVPNHTADEARARGRYVLENDERVEQLRALLAERSGRG